MSVVDILRHGKAAIARDGWRQGPRYAGGLLIEPVRHCMMDALVAGCDWPTEDIRTAQQALVEACNRKGRLAALRWNDRPGRTVAHVNAVYDLAIAATLATGWM